MAIIDHQRSPNWPKLGPSMLIATALVVGIRTAKWATKVPGVSDVDPELDQEVDFAIRITIRVMRALLRHHPGLFPEKQVPIYEPDDESPA
ncbi:MAG TPA: hypothetical protein VFW25_04760 [Silvibacterium sp.]|nr:hypothetical protein [Silvibacterium sp.]